MAPNVEDGQSRGVAQSQLSTSHSVGSPPGSLLAPQLPFWNGHILNDLKKQILLESHPRENSCVCIPLVLVFTSGNTSNRSFVLIAFSKTLLSLYVSGNYLYLYLNLYHLSVCLSVYRIIMHHRGERNPLLLRVLFEGGIILTGY